MLAISVDVGGTTLKIGASSADGVLTHQRQVPTPQGVDTLVDTVREQVRELHAELEADDLRAAEAVGVVVPGIVDEQTGTGVLSANLGWRDAPLRDLFTEALGAPVAFGHDVRAGALAEHRWGAGAGVNDDGSMLFVAIGTGLAAGLILNNVPFSGHGYAGELGHLLVTDPATGERIILEQVASASAIARRLAALSPTFDEARGSRGVLEEISFGDQQAQRVLGDAIGVLADALAGALCTIGPVPIVIGGGLSNAGDVLLTPLHQALSARLTVIPVPTIRRAQLGARSQCLGAGALALDLTHKLARTTDPTPAATVSAPSPTN